MRTNQVINEICKRHGVELTAGEIFAICNAIQVDIDMAVAEAVQRHIESEMKEPTKRFL